MSCASRGSRRSRRPTAYLRERFVPAATTPPSRAPPRDPASAFVAARHGRSRSDPVSRRGARRRRATTPSTLDGQRLPDRARSPAAAAAPGWRVIVRRHLDGHLSAIVRAAPQRLADRCASPTGRSPWTLPRPWTPQNAPTVAWKTPRAAVPTAPTGLTLRKRSDHLSNGSGQITC